MDFGNLATIWALRAAFKLAWGIARIVRALGAAGERLEAVVDAPLIAAARG